MNTRHKGNIAVAHAIAYFSTNGYSVFLPVGDAGGAIDILVSADNIEIKRVQCKYTTHRHQAALERYPDKPIWDVNISRYSKENADGLATKCEYTDNSFDILFVATPEGNYLIDWKTYCAEIGKPPRTLRIGQKMAKWKI